MSDLIDRQAAIDALDGEIEITGRTNAEAVKGYVRLVRDRLERLPSAQSTMGQQNDGDTISRRMAIDAMANTLWHYPNECYRNLNEYEFAKGLAELGLKSVPSVQPTVGQVNQGKAVNEQPEIIHCCECKWLQYNMRPDGYLPKGVDEFECRHWCGYCDPMDFCSYAERRTE